MKEYVVTVTAKGQVTIPAGIRRRLDLVAGGTVAFVLDDDGIVRLAPSGLTFEAMCGIVPPQPGRDIIDVEDVIDEAMQEEADRIVREMGGL